MPDPKPVFPYISDAEFENAAGRIEVHRHYAPREPRVTRVDRLGYGRWMTDYLTARARGSDHEHAIRAVEKSLDDATDGDEPGPPGDPWDVPIIKRDGRVFVDVADGALHDYREISAFMLLARLLRGEDIRPILRGWRQRRFNRVRVLGMVGTSFWTGRGWDLRPSMPGYDHALDRLFSICGEEDMGVRFTLFADAQVCMPDPAEQRRHAALVSSIAAGYPHVILEMANEPDFNGWGQEWGATLAELAKAVDSRHIVALGAESAQDGHLPTADREPADYVTFHAERVLNEGGWAWLRRLAEYGVVLDGERPVVSGEPVNFGDDGAPGDFLRDPAIWFCYGALSRVVPSHGYAPCMHFHRGLWAELPVTQSEENCILAFHAGCDAVPMDAKHGQWVNGHWAEAPWRGYSQTNPPSDDKPSRIFGRLVNGVYWGVSVREPKGWSWPDLRYDVSQVALCEGEKFACSVWREV